jgi:hypothetical protein
MPKAIVGYLTVLLVPSIALYTTLVLRLLVRLLRLISIADITAVSKFSHKRQQWRLKGIEEGIGHYTIILRASNNVASRWDGISMSVADRMEQSCPMCGAYTLWQCKCIEDGVKLINPEALRCKTDRSMAELNTAMKCMAMETPTQPPQQSGFRTPVSIAKPFKTAKAPKGRVLDLTTPVKPQ